jgi:hypothetical protein
MSLVPNLFLATMATLLVGAFAGVAYVVGLTLLGLEVEDAMRGRMFGLVQSLMRIDLLLVTATTPFIAGRIGVREGPLGVSVNGVSVVLLVGGLLAVASGSCPTGRWTTAGVPLRRLAPRLRPAAHAARRHFVALEGGEGAASRPAAAARSVADRAGTTSSSPRAGATRSAGAPLAAARPATAGAPARRPCSTPPTARSTSREVSPALQRAPSS